MLIHAHRSLILSLTLLAGSLTGCDEKGGGGADAGADLGTDASMLCNTAGLPTEAPLTSAWPGATTPPTVDDFGVCDVETTGVTLPSDPFSLTPTYEVTVGCGRRTFAGGTALASRVASFDTADALVSWRSTDADPASVEGVSCESYGFWAGEQMVPDCASETTFRCRPGTCPHFLPAGTTTLSGLVDAFDAGTTLAAMDAASTCTTAPSSLPPEPAWGTDYVAIRTEGCGVVTYTLPFGPWVRAVVYDATTGAPVGATSLDDVPAEREGASCADEVVTVGSYPAPACPTDVVTYCTSAAGVTLR